MSNASGTILLLAGLIFFSCRKEEPIPAPVTPEPETPATGTGEVLVVLSHLVGNEALELSKKFPLKGTDSLSVYKFSYYLSNVTLSKSDGVKYAEPGSYHLVNHAAPSTASFVLKGVPPGSYNALDMMIGVDSTRSSAGAGTGDLDPAKGMYWTWNSGYIFYKLEGKVYNGDKNPAITYHIGGYSGAYKAQRTFRISLLKSQIVVSENHTSVVYLNADVREVFDSPHPLDLNTQNYQMSEGPLASTIADNYADMFSFADLKN